METKLASSGGTRSGDGGAGCDLHRHVWLGSSPDTVDRGAPQGASRRAGWNLQPSVEFIHDAVASPVSFRARVEFLAPGKFAANLCSSSSNNRHSVAIRLSVLNEG